MKSKRGSMILAVFLLAAHLTLFWALVMWLWNNGLTHILSVRPVGFVEAALVVFLIRLVIGRHWESEPLDAETEYKTLIKVCICWGIGYILVRFM